VSATVLLNCMAAITFTTGTVPGTIFLGILGLHLGFQQLCYTLLPYFLTDPALAKMCAFLLSIGISEMLILWYHSYSALSLEGASVLLRQPRPEEPFLEKISSKSLDLSDEANKHSL
jgi:hypothetical protein